MACRKYLISWAQNATPTHTKFFAALRMFAKVEKAELIIIAGRYVNPTSRSDHFESDDQYAEELEPYLAAKPRRSGDVSIMEPTRRRLAKSLTLFSDINVQPTASHPLTGFEVFAAKDSGIFGHPKRALQVVPTATRTPRVLWTTGACTVPNYSDSKAGKKARAHHVLGAVVVEVDSDGLFFVRHVTANARTGEFTDLDRVYGPNGSRRAPRAETLVMGDYHAGREEEHVLEATEALCDLVKPKAVVLHDLFDGAARNHHETKKLKFRYATRFDTVKAEVAHCAAAADRVAGWGAHDVIVVDSNHNDSVWRWLEDHDQHRDPVNNPYYHFLWSAAYDHRDRTGEWPNLLEREFRRHRVSKRVRFLKRDESYMRKHVEHSMHGHLGVNGARSNAKGFAKLGIKLTKGHEHTPSIVDGVFCAGVSAQLDMGYNPLPSTWMHAHVLLHADGKRQLVFLFKGRFRGGK